MNQERYFVTAIGTDSGKTLVSAILVQAFQADYWKPVQAGYPTDSDTVSKLINNKHCIVHPEAYLLKHPMSPHAAAKLEHIEIEISNIKAPYTESPTLVIEGAGGVLVPLNNSHFVIDLAHHLDATIILVCNLYLGSINHSLLTIQEIKSRGLRVKGIVFNGPENTESENYILQFSGYPCLLRIPPCNEAPNQEFVQKMAIKLFENWS
jgi:dethiobiotin synthetase